MSKNIAPATEILPHRIFYNFLDLNNMAELIFISDRILQINEDAKGRFHYCTGVVTRYLEEALAQLELHNRPYSIADAEERAEILKQFVHLKDPQS